MADGPTVCLAGSANRPLERRRGRPTPRIVEPSTGPDRCPRRASAMCCNRVLESHNRCRRRRGGDGRRVAGRPQWALSRWRRRVADLHSPGSVAIIPGPARYLRIGCLADRRHRRDRSGFDEVVEGPRRKNNHRSRTQYSQAGGTTLSDLASRWVARGTQGPLSAAPVLEDGVL